MRSGVLVTRTRARCWIRDSRECRADGGWLLLPGGLGDRGVAGFGSFRGFVGE